MEYAQSLVCNGKVDPCRSVCWQRVLWHWGHQSDRLVFVVAAGRSSVHRREWCWPQRVQQHTATRNNIKSCLTRPLWLCWSNAWLLELPRKLSSKSTVSILDNQWVMHFPTIHIHHKIHLDLAGWRKRDQRQIKILPARYPRSGSFHGYADDGSGRSAKSFNTAFQPRHKLPLRALKGQCKKASAHHGLIVERCEIAESMRNEM